MWPLIVEYLSVILTAALTAAVLLISTAEIMGD